MHRWDEMMMRFVENKEETVVGKLSIYIYMIYIICIFLPLEVDIWHFQVIKVNSFTFGFWVIFELRNSRRSLNLHVSPTWNRTNPRKNSWILWFASRWRRAAWNGRFSSRWTAKQRILERGNRHHPENKRMWWKWWYRIESLRRKLREKQHITLVILEIVEVWGFSQIAGSNDTDIFPGLYNQYTSWTIHYCTANYNKFHTSQVLIAEFPPTVVYIKNSFCSFGRSMSASQMLIHCTRGNVQSQDPLTKFLLPSQAGKLEGSKIDDVAIAAPQNEALAKGALKIDSCLICQDCWKSMVEWIAKRNSQCQNWLSIDSQSSKIGPGASEACIVKKGWLVKVPFRQWRDPCYIQWQVS